MRGGSDTDRAEHRARQQRAKDAAAAAGRAAKGRGLAGRRVGLVGSTVIRHATVLELREQLGATQLVGADEILERLRAVKSEREIEQLRHAANVGVGWMTTMLEAVA